MATFKTGVFGIDMSLITFGQLTSGFSALRDPTAFSVVVDAEVTSFIGAGFTYDGNGLPSAGTVTEVRDAFQGQLGFDVTGLNISALSFVRWALAGDESSALQAVLGGADSIIGGTDDDHLIGLAGADTIMAGTGADSVEGGDGQDVLWGEDGNDSISGGADFDNINGNKGADSIHGDAGDDWVSGGQDNDVVYGDDGHDLVYGNLGDDTVYGGNGDDWIRGGQGNDIVDGGTGNDLIWGDRGDDTLTGGSGADQFHTFAGAGKDTVTDFNGAEGDRVVIDDHADYKVAASGSDTVITLTATGDTVVLQGVAFASFHADWVIQA